MEDQGAKKVGFLEGFLEGFYGGLGFRGLSK